MADVFISYHRSEGTSALVRRIAAELERIGIFCWYDTKDPDPGYFVQTIEQEILRCKVFLLIWDEGANNSEWCLTETYTAFNGKNHSVRVPFQVGTFTKHPEMGFYMRRCQIFGGGNSPENADIEKLIAKIAALFGKTPAKFVDEDDAPTKIFDDAPAKIKEPPVNIIQSGSCGENVIYTLDEKGLLTISGYGDMDSYYGGKTPWLNRHQMISAVRIQKGVTSIGSSTFYKCRSLASVTIPDSVTSIGNEAFYGCCRLTGVTIPDSVTSIGNEAFASCNSLINVTVPDNVTSIGLLAFYTCSSLTSITILDGATSIGIGAFMGCDRLTSVTIPDSVIFIGERAFAYCGKLKSVSVPAKATIENDAFPDTTKVIRRE